jgi:hypothetical protein
MHQRRQPATKRNACRAASPVRAVTLGSSPMHAVDARCDLRSGFAGAGGEWPPAYDSRRGAGNYVSATLGNYVSDNPSDLGNFMSADTLGPRFRPRLPRPIPTTANLTRPAGCRTNRAGVPIPAGTIALTTVPETPSSPACQRDRPGSSWTWRRPTSNRATSWPRRIPPRLVGPVRRDRGPGDGVGA